MNYYRKELRLRKLRLKESNSPASSEERSRKNIMLSDDAALFHNPHSNSDEYNLSFVTKEVGTWSGTRDVRCMVCWAKIEPGEETASCPHCNSTAHKEHLDRWFDLRGNRNCPRCRRQIPE